MAQYPHKKNVITAKFGYYSPFGTRKMHYAHDYGNNGWSPQAMPVGACIAGTAADVGYDASRGNYVVLRGFWSEETDAIVEVFHLHNTVVKAGQTVQPGETLGFQGNTGSSTAQHTHVGFYLVPKDYAYSKNGVISDRDAYAVDPMAFLHVGDGQTVDVNGKYETEPIPAKEPRPADLTPIKGSFSLLSDVEVFFLPYNRYAPIVGGEGGRKRYLGHFFPDRTTFEAVYVCHTADAADGKEIEWAGIQTPWGLLWAPVTEGRSTLHYEKESEAVGLPSEKETVLLRMEAARQALEAAAQYLAQAQQEMEKGDDR